MQKKSIETFLFQEAARLSSLDGIRSIKKIVEQDVFRANSYIIAYHITKNKFLQDNTEKGKKINKEIANFQNGNTNSSYYADVQKAINSYQYYLASNEKTYLFKYVQDTEYLFGVCKKLKYSYGNAYRFFIKHEQGALTKEKAQKITREILEIKKMNSNKK